MKKILSIIKFLGYSIQELKQSFLKFKNAESEMRKIQEKKIVALLSEEMEDFLETEEWKRRGCQSCMLLAFDLFMIIDTQKPEVINFKIDYLAQEKLAFSLHTNKWQISKDAFGVDFLNELISQYSSIEHYEVCAEIKKVIS